MSMRTSRASLAVFVGAAMLVCASTYALVPAEAQGIVKDSKKSAATKGPSKGTSTKAPAATFKAAKQPPVVVKKAPATVKKPPVVVKKAPVIVKKPPVVVKKPAVVVKKPPVIVKKPPAAKKPPVIVYHRPWRPGLRWRWIGVPTIIIVQNLEWCHYHRYPIPDVRFHRGIECHQHAWWVPWDHPSIRYVEAY